MNNKTIIDFSIKLIFLLFVLLITLSVIVHYYVTAPEIHKIVKSPNNSWTVTLYAKNISFGGSWDVFVIIKNKNNKTVFHEKIDQRDVWEEIEDRYREITFAQKSIKIGPKYTLDPPYYIIPYETLNE